MNNIMWTKPYYGVQHRTDVDRPYQITLTDRGEFVEVMLLNSESENPFTPVKEHHGSRESCEELAESWASNLN